MSSAPANDPTHCDEDDDDGGSNRCRQDERLNSREYWLRTAGTRYRNVHVSCLLQRQTTDRIALPAWVLAYRYRGSPYRAIVHGQRADIVVGSSPTDWRKVLWIVLAAAFVVAAIAAIAMSR